MQALPWSSATYYKSIEVSFKSCSLKESRTVLSRKARGFSSYAEAYTILRELLLQIRVYSVVRLVVSLVCIFKGILRQSQDSAGVTASRPAKVLMVVLS